MNNTEALQNLIDSTANQILDEWTAEAASAGIEIDSYISDQLDNSDDEIAMTVGPVYLRRVMGAAA